MDFYRIVFEIFRHKKEFIVVGVIALDFHLFHYLVQVISFIYIIKYFSIVIERLHQLQRLSTVDRLLDTPIVRLYLKLSSHSHLLWICQWPMKYGPIIVDNPEFNYSILITIPFFLLFYLLLYFLLTTSYDTRCLARDFAVALCTLF